MKQYLIVLNENDSRILNKLVNELNLSCFDMNVEPLTVSEYIDFIIHYQIAEFKKKESKKK